MTRTELRTGVAGDTFIETEETKPGWKSTEFWLTGLVIVGVVVLMLADKLTVEDVVQLWPLFASVAGYALSRGMAKGAR